MPHIAGFRGALAGAEQDPLRAVYRYHQRFAGPGRTFERKNLILAVALSPLSEGTIRPHEMTTEAGRDAELARIRAAKAHDQPVLLGFRDPANEVDRLFRKIESGTPTHATTTADGTEHRVWRVNDAELLGKLRHYFAPRKLHLLEGHDRYEGMLAYQAELAAASPLSQYASANYAMSCLVNLEDPTLVTAPRHRIVRVTGGAAPAPEAILAAARAYFLIDTIEGAARDLAKQHAALADTVAHQPAFVVVFAGGSDAYKLTLSPEVSPFAEGVTPHRSLQKLDPVVVDGLFVGKAIPNATLTSTPVIADAIAALDAKDAGAAAIVVMRPLSVEQIAHVDELGQLLPAGSTAFHPPLAPDLIKMLIDPDEDLV